MEWLKNIVGEDLFKQVETKVNEHNGKVENKDKQVKIVNVNDGEYVSKLKYTTLENELNTTKTSLQTANTTIEDLKKNNTNNADLQAKITQYETEKQDLEKAHKETTSKLIKMGGIREALYEAKAKYPDLLAEKFDLSKIVLDEKGEKVVSGIKEQMDTIKESYKDLLGETNDNNSPSPYNYVPRNPGNPGAGGSADFVSIIRENQVKR